MPASGGDAIQVFGPHESPDGRFLHYAKALFDIRLWRIPVEGRLAARVLENLSRHLNVALAASGIYFVPSAASGFPVQFLDRNTNRIATFASFKGRLNLE